MKIKFFDAYANNKNPDSKSSILRRKRFELFLYEFDINNTSKLKILNFDGQAITTKAIQNG